MNQPWGMAFLPPAYVFTERSERCDSWTRAANLEPVKGTALVLRAGRQACGRGACLRLRQDRLDYPVLFDRRLPAPRRNRAANRTQPGAADHDLCRARQGQCQHEWATSRSVQYTGGVPIDNTGADHYGSRPVDGGGKGHFFMAHGRDAMTCRCAEPASPMGKIHLSISRDTVPKDNPSWHSRARWAVLGPMVPQFRKA